MVGCGQPVSPATSIVTNKRPSSIAGPKTTVAHPRFEITDINGQTHRPFDDVDVKAVALVFLVSDCPIANSYVPELNRLDEEYESRGVKMFVIQVDPDLSVEAARQFVVEFRLRPSLVLDRKHELVKKTGARISPEVAVLSPAGELLYIGRIDDRYIGFGQRREHVTSSDLRNALDEILSGQPVTRARVEPIGCDIPDVDSSLLGGDLP